jgi:hypothetical protein
VQYYCLMVEKAKWINKNQNQDTVFAFLPLVAYFVQYSLRILLGERFDGSFIGNNTLMNFLSASVLKSDPIESLWGLHTQPPLLNGIYAIALQFYPYEKTIVELLWILIGLGLVYCVYLFILELTKSKKISALMAILFQLVPSTIGYIFHAYNTILIQFLFSLLMLGLVKVINMKKIGILIMDFALLLLFLGRAPFVSLFVLFGMALTRIYFYRNTKEKKILYKSTLAVILPVVIIIQGHFFLDFKQVALSSWGGNSTLRALINGVGSEELARQIGDNPCRLEILEKQGQGQVITAFPSCYEKYSKIQVRTTKKAAEGNFRNSTEALQASIAAQDLLKHLLPKNLDALPKILMGNSEKLGTVEYFFGLSKFPLISIAFLKENLNFLLSLSTSLIYFVFLVRKKDSVKELKLVLTSWLLMSYILFYSLFTEVLENDRYKIEGNVVYFLVSSTIIWQFYLRNFNKLKLRRLKGQARIES